MSKWLATAAVLTATAALVPVQAQACGGFFCNNTPVNQSGERVLFAVDGDTVTAHIQIFYQGEAEKFAWLLPLPTRPDKIGVGTDALFQQLEWRTRPQFNVEWAPGSECYWYGNQMDDGDFAPSAGGEGSRNSDGVAVLAEDSVGPYDYVVLKGTSKTSGEAVFKWLDDNGYDQPPVSKDHINTYVAEGHTFVAIKLQSDKEVGDIQPLVIDFPFPGSCVPLRLTSIASTDDMNVTVYMLGDHRAVPINYFHVEINEKKIDWMSGGSNYSDLAREAVDTANGRGFLTEYAGDTNSMKSVLWQPGKYDTDALLTKTTPWDFVAGMLAQNFPRTPQMQQIIRRHIPKPESLEDVTDQNFYNNLVTYKEQLASLDFDPQAMVGDIIKEVFDPMKDASTLFETHRYMTRMFTIISPNEMTRDPIFLFNPDLPNVSNVHRATAKATCKPDKPYQPETVTVTLADGTVLSYKVPDDSGMPVLEGADDLGGAAAAVQRMYTSGLPELVAAANIDSVDSQFDTITLGLVTDLTSPPKTNGTGTSDGSSGCTAGSSTASFAGFGLVAALALFGLVALRRRRDVSALLVAAVCAGAMAFTPADAEACGGFFCSNTPVDQSGERVLFGVKDGTVTAHIQIFYQGEAEKFAWVLPIPAEPTRIGVGTDMLFTQLMNRTRPTFQLEWANTDGCWYYGGGWGFEDAASDGAPPPSPGGANKDVDVLMSGDMGPYTYAVIKAKGTGASSAVAVFEWLDENGYDQPELAKDHIHTYVAESHVFVAVKLQSDKASGDIQPLILDYPLPAGCVPLRLTSIAATEDMEVWVYMLGNTRAVPVNYFHVEINEKLIDWVRGGNNYGEIAREAVNTAAGRGFMTEYAGDTNGMKGVLWKPGMLDTTPLLSKKTPWEFVAALLSYGFPRTPQMQNLVRRHIPKPEGLESLTDSEFYNNLEGYKAELASLAFDPAEFVADIETDVIAPLQEANGLFEEYRYMTRLYTIISPAEMIRDPIFMFNADLPNVSNLHRAVGKALCEPGESEAKSVEVILNDGTKVTYTDLDKWDEPPTVLDAETLGGPAALVARMYTSGAPEAVAAEDIAAVDKSFNTVTLGLVTDGDKPRGPGGTGQTGSSGESAPSSGCTAGGAVPATGLALLALLGLGFAIVLRRRYIA